MSRFAPLPVLLLLAALSASLPAAGQVAYVDRAAERGIALTWSDYYPTGDFGTGSAMEDFDHDGDLDLFIGTKRGRGLGVYRNDGDTFADLTDQFDLSADRDIKQVLFADLDEDGWRDLVLTVWEPDEPGTSFLGSTIRVYQGLENGAFMRRSAAVFDSVMTGLATGVAAGDIDRDGDLDLYVCVWKPGAYDDTSANRLLRNDRTWNFTDVGADLGVNDPRKSFMVSLADLSGDGWPDILVSEDKRGGLTYYESAGDGTFTNRTVDSGLDGYVFIGGIKADAMGIAVDDYDGDHLLDVYITNIFDGNLLYRNNGDGTWTDVAVPSGTLNLRVSWGTAFIDADCDMLRDLYVANFGMNGNSVNVDRLYGNQGDGTFVDWAPDAGITFAEDGFGASVGDVDGDGGLDVLLTQGLAPVRLMMNEGTRGNWLHLDLVGTDSNRDAVGAKVTVWAGGVSQFDEQMAGESYLNAHSHELEFGLGTADRADSVVVWWPSGQTQTWTDLAANARHLLVEREAAVTAPQLVARWDGRMLKLSWAVHDPLKWEKFELWREEPGAPVMLEAPAADPATFFYSYRDEAASAEASYMLKAMRAESGEVMTSIASAPDLPPPAFLKVEYPRPNPFNPRVEVPYFVPGDEVPRLRVLDLRGRVVAHLAAPAGTGWQTAVWEGLTDGGRAAGSGTYLFEIRTRAETRRLPMTLIR